MILEALVIVFGTVLFTIIWPLLAVVMAVVVIPTLRKVLGNSFADATTTLVSWIDDRACLAKDKALSLYRGFKQRVLGMNTTWTVNGLTADETTQIVIAQDGGQFEIATSRRTIPYEKLPAKVREEHNRLGVSQVTHDLGDGLDGLIAECG